MVSFLQGLGALGSGLVSGYETGASMADRRRKRQREEEAYTDKTAGESALMKALGASPTGGPPQPQMAPGQPSQPMQLPGGAPMQVASLQNAIYGQESGFGRNPATSPKGAMGGMQVMPATFQQFARPGENISDPAANKAVGDRILASYMQKYGDPARAAVAYFSGPGNVAPPGSPTPWKRDASDGRVSTSQYVQQVLGRMGGGQRAPSSQIAMGGGGDWRQFAQRIIQANPNLSPGAFLHALQAAQPFMNMESRQQLQEMGLGLREKALESRERMFGAAESRKAEEGKTKATQAERKMDIEQSKVSAQMERFKTQQQGINDRFAQRFKQAEDRLAYAKSKDEKARVLQDLRQAEQDRRAAMANRVKAAAAGMDTKELKALEAEEQQAKREAERRIDELTKQARGDAAPAARPSLDEIWGK